MANTKLHPAELYAQQVRDKQILTCELVQLAVQRYYRDLDNAFDKGWYFDRKAAVRAITFIERLKHTKGEWAGQRFRLEPWQQFIITTAGFNKNGACYAYRDNVVKVLRGVNTDDTLFGIIYTLDDQSEWDNPKMWIKSNPNLGVSLSADYLADQVTDAKNRPHFRICAINSLASFPGCDILLASQPAPAYRITRRPGRNNLLAFRAGHNMLIAFRAERDKEKGAAQGRLPEPEAKQRTNKCQPIQILLSVPKRVCNTN